MATTPMELAQRSEYAELNSLLHAKDDVVFSIYENTAKEDVRWFVDGLANALTKTGRGVASSDDLKAQLVLNVTSRDKPTPYRRRSRAVFVASIVTGPAPKDALKQCYPYLIRTLSNVLLYISLNHEDSSIRVHFITPEQGHALMTATAGNEEALFDEVAARLMPIASSHLVIENEFYDDLPEEFYQGDDNTRAFFDVGQQLDALDLLPAPFDLEKLLTPDDLKHLRRLYKMGGLSHGNMSQRLDEQRFWMSASGVDKSHMKQIGQDILLVKGFSAERQSMLLSVPPGVTPRRVSVDAIEHWMIYTEHPGVGAILHVHAWMDGVNSTDVAYPCGTVELAHAVASLLRREPNPEQAVIGLKNHGLTITGKSLPEIMSRVGDRLLRQIPMD